MEKLRNITFESCACHDTIIIWCYKLILNFMPMIELVTKHDQQNHDGSELTWKILRQNKNSENTKKIQQLTSSSLIY